MLAEAGIEIRITVTEPRRNYGLAADLSSSSGAGLSTLELVVVGAQEKGAGRRLDPWGRGEEEPLLRVWA